MPRKGRVKGTAPGAKRGPKPKLENRPDAEDILREVIAPDANLTAIARRIGVHDDTLRNFRDKRVPNWLLEILHRAGNGALQAAQLDAVAALNRISRRMELYFDAAERWLQDPDDPKDYTLAPRETEVLVIWEEQVPKESGEVFRTVKHKERLIDLLKRCGLKGGPGVEEILMCEINTGNPRKLFLDGVNAGKPLYELLGKATGQIKPDPAGTVNVTVILAEAEELKVAFVETACPTCLPAFRARVEAIAAKRGGR